MPENSWLQVNANLYSDVWTSPDLEPLYGLGPVPPSKIILAWSGFAWDSNRGDLILYGGGHANYAGNDVYRWHSSSLMWERASLPSEVRVDPVAGYQAIDGVDAAPSSAHTYKNNMFLPAVDRFLTWGGAEYGTGGPYLRVSETDPTQARFTGPYLFDPNRADGNKVGGTTGSNVMRVIPTPIAGGQMWQNRDIYLHLAGQAMPDKFGDSCAAYASEGGLDVAYALATNAGTNQNLFRYQLTSLSNPNLDQIGMVGTYGGGPAVPTTCGYDQSRSLFVYTGDNTTPFFFWDLTTPGPSNLSQQVQIESTISSFQSWLTQKGLDITGVDMPYSCALEFDPVRKTFPVWCGDGAIWELHAPLGGNTTSGWTMTQEPAPQGPVPPRDTGTGILGKWRYAPYYDVFVGLENINEGQIWIYKPASWVQPNPAGNILPNVAITSPATGTSVSPGTPLSIVASASDPDGSIARVEFYVNKIKIGVATSAPYAQPWKPMFVGTYAIVAVAVDNVGGMTASAAADLTVSAPLTTVTLQRGLSGYAGVMDTTLDAFDPDNPSYGVATEFYLDTVNYTPLIRFAIFQSEGGSVPNRSVIQSAQLQLYKQYYNDPLQLNALLKPWSESQATWNHSQAGTAWNVGGAAGAGTDYVSAVDALVAPDWNPGWVAFDVTSRVQTWSDFSAVNYGWRIAEVGTGGNYKEFYSSEYATDPTLRPVLTVVYAPAPQNPTATVIASSSNPSYLDVAVTFAATVTGAAPTGTVSFTDGGVAVTGCGAVALPPGSSSSKTANCVASGLAIGSHQIVARYSGDPNNQSSISAPLFQVVKHSGNPITNPRDNTNSGR